MKTLVATWFLILVFCYLGPAAVQSQDDPPSAVGGAQTRAVFHNASPVQVEVYWIDYSGNSVIYYTLNPGQSGGIITYIGHPWIATDTEGNRMKMNLQAIFFPVDCDATVEITQ